MQGLHAKNSKIRSDGISDEIFISPVFDGEDRTCRRSHIGRGMHDDDGSPKFSTADPQDGKDAHARASTDVMGNSHLNPKYSKREKRHTGEPGYYKGNEKLKGEYDDEDLQVNGGKVKYHRNSSSESGGEKYRMSACLPSHDRYRKHSGEHRDLSYAGRLKSGNDLNAERMVVSGSQRGHVSRDLGRERSASYCSREAQDRDRSKDRDLDRDLKREKKQERSRNREVELVFRREKEHGSSYGRNRRDVKRGRSREREDDRDGRREKERDRSWETVYERDRRREKQRDRSRDGTRGGEKDRDWESQRYDKNQERDKIKERVERQDVTNRHKYREVVNGKDEHLHHDDGYDSRDRYRRHSRHEETEWHQERKRNFEPEKVYNCMGSTLVDDENKLQR